MTNFRIASVVGLLVAAASVAGFGQDARVGTSKPEAAVITASPDAETPVAKPSAAIPAEKPDVYGPYVPYVAPGSAAAAVNPDGAIVGDTVRRPLTDAVAPKPADDPDAGIVTHVVSRPGEVPDGTLFKVKLREGISTVTTRTGNRFSAEVTEPVESDGRVVVPVGSTLEGRVSWVHGGKRIGGAAAIHLEPQTVTLPDGAQYVLHARAIDTSSWDNTRVDSEGTILRRDRMKGTLKAGALVIGGGVATGALIGGVPGALIGVGVGAGVTAVVWLKQDRQAVLPKDLGVVFSLTSPMPVTPAVAIVQPVMASAGTPGGE